MLYPHLVPGISLLLFFHVASLSSLLIMFTMFTQDEFNPRLLGTEPSLISIHATIFGLGNVNTSLSSNLNSSLTLV